MIPIPAGEFIMGSDDGNYDEKPAHTVYLDSYEVGKYPVTVAQYRKFCEATGREPQRWCGLASGWKDNHPVAEVTWDDAAAYCKWAGGRLPTEAEWEKAARGTDGRKYPWGNTWDKTKCANSELGSGSAPVGSYPAGASPYGCMHMAGNVFEWCADRYDDSYYKACPSRNPEGPSSGICRVRRGGSWYNEVIYDRCAYRSHYDPDWYSVSNGFRLVR
jgi:formylglycine-generating enzyme required for sulfatase activity